MLPDDLNALLGITRPSGPPTQPVSRGPTLADWLAVNGLQQADLAWYLSRIPEPRSTRASCTVPDDEIPASPVDAWTRCAERLKDAFPRLGVAIDRVATDTPRALTPDPAKHPQPFTYDLGYETMPFVSLHYRGRAADLLAMAHEFGHALQIVASWTAGDGRMPPLARECCAFLAERAMLAPGAAPYAALRAAHTTDDLIYFGAATTALKDAMSSGSGTVRYDWNYPIARYLAARLFDEGDADTCADAFRQGRNGSACLLDLDRGRTDGGLAA